MEPRCVADVEGPWEDPNFESGLIERCRRYWNVPMGELTNEALATYLRQKIGMEVVVPEAKRRLELHIDDDSEMYEGELANALRDVIGT